MATDRLAHLLRKVTFHTDAREAAALAALGLEGAVDALLAAEPEPLQAGEIPPYSQKPVPGEYEELVLAWLRRLVSTRAQLREKLTLFWHSHFATAMHKVRSPHLMGQHVALLRERGLGRFADLLLGVARDPAMLIWLDGVSNRKAEPNENFAREVLELFTVGIGHYSEDDVTELARAWTGWRVDRATGAAHFVPAQHDRGYKRVLGAVGKFDDTGAVAILAAHPQTARRIGARLWSYFAYPVSDADPEVEPLAVAFRATDGNLRAVLRALFLSDALYSDRALRAVVRQPADYVAGTLRALRLQPDRWVLGFLRRMGQELYNPPSVAGWPGGAAWLGAAPLLARFHFAYAAVQVAAREQTLPRAGSLEADLDLWLSHLGLDDLSAASRQALADYARGGAGLTPAAREERSRGVAQAVLACPEYQLI